MPLLQGCWKVVKVHSGQSIEGCSAASLLACLALGHCAIPDFASPMPAYLALDATGILELIVLRVGRCKCLYHQMSGSC